MTSYYGRKIQPKVSTTFPVEDINAHYLRNNSDNAYDVQFRFRERGVGQTITTQTLRLQAGEIHPQDEEIITNVSTTSNGSIEYGNLA